MVLMHALWIIWSAKMNAWTDVDCTMLCGGQGTHVLIILYCANILMAPIVTLRHIRTRLGTEILSYLLFVCMPMCQQWMILASLAFNYIMIRAYVWCYSVCHTFFLSSTLFFGTGTHAILALDLIRWKQNGLWLFFSFWLNWISLLLFHPFL